VKNEVLCLQIGRIFAPEFDVFAPIPEDQKVPPIAKEQGMSILCTTREGPPAWKVISGILAPLFAHPRVVIATFDFTNDILILEQIGITPNFDGIIDAQLLRSPVESDLLTWTENRSLGNTILEMNIRDPMLVEAKKVVTSVKEFPWDENEALIAMRGLPVTSTVTKRFLQYAASDIALTGLALAEVLVQRKVEWVHTLTRTKVAEYKKAQADFGLTGPRLMRQAAFIRPKFPLWISGGRLKDDGTHRVLKSWRGLLELEDIRKGTRDELLRVEKSPEELRELIVAHVVALKEAQHWSVLTTRCVLSGPPDANLM
jgi:hypothetical protein